MSDDYRLNFSPWLHRYMVRKSASLAQQVVDEILAGLQVGDLAREGGGLPSEAELSGRFNVSRATVREALSRLEQAGVVIRRHGVGTFVASRPPVIDTGLEELESLEMFAQRSGLETHISRTAIEESGLLTLGLGGETSGKTFAKNRIRRFRPETPKGEGRPKRSAAWFDKFTLG
jgi:DNA-binding GntR family transcriptional regulator